MLYSRERISKIVKGKNKQRSNGRKLGGKLVTLIKGGERELVKGKTILEEEENMMEEIV